MVLLVDDGQVEACFSMVYAERTIDVEIILGAPDGTPRRHGQVESHFGPFGDSVCVSARSVHCLRHRYGSLRNHFGCTRWYS
jgi:hypothetical protein